jgi:hypothetical protein
MVMRLMAAEALAETKMNASASAVIPWGAPATRHFWEAPAEAASPAHPGTTPANPKHQATEAEAAEAARHRTARTDESPSNGDQHEGAN